jgi:hypothetical protein
VQSYQFTNFLYKLHSKFLKARRIQRLQQNDVNLGIFLRKDICEFENGEQRKLKKESEMLRGTEEGTGTWRSQIVKDKKTSN